MAKSSVRVTNRMRQVIETIEHKASAAVLKAIILGASEVAPITPRASSNLVNNQFRDVTKEGSRIVGTFGYTANYAAAVHAAPGKYLGLNKLRDPKNPARGVFWGPAAVPHFVTVGFERAKPNIDAVIEKAMKL